MRVIYIAGPFRAINPHTGKSDAWRVQQNVMMAMTLALEVWKSGAVAICPHSNTMFFQDAHGVFDQVWLDGDLELLHRSDAVLLTPDWQRSRGATAEREYAIKLGLPVFESVGEFLVWMEGQ